MPLLKDLLLELNNTLANNEIVAIAGASGIAEIEVGEETMTAIKSKMGGLMSADDAKNNHDLEDHFKRKLYPTIKGELLGNIDTDISSTVKNMFGDDAVDQLKEKEFTGDKIKFFAELTKKAIESKDGGDDTIKELNTNLNKQIVELNTNIDKIKKDNEKELKKNKTGYENSLIEKGFEATFNSYNLGDKYNEELFKNALRDDIRTKVNTVAKLTLSEDGNIIPKHPENAGLELFVNNVKIETLKDVLNPLMEGHIKANNVDQKQDKLKYKPAPEVKLSKMAQDLIASRKESMTI